MQKLYSINLVTFFLIFISLIINTKNEINKKKDKSIKNKRILQEEEIPVQLSMYFDLYNFNETFNPAKLGNTTDIFINSMNEAHNILSKILMIKVDSSSDLVMYSNYKEDWGLSSWNEQLFINGSTLDYSKYNYFIFFKFSSLDDVDMISKIVLTYTYDTPLMGLITINEEMEESKITQDYLIPLFLQQLIRLLGFHAPYETGKVTLDTIIKADIDQDQPDETEIDDLIIYKVYVESENVIKYAREYFDCPSINQIELEIDKYNNIYWPSRLFLGDIMTKFDNYEEKVISKLTLILLQDLGLDTTQEYQYIHLVDDSYLTGGLMRFGKHKGCEFVNEACAPDNTNKLYFSNEFYLPTDTTLFPEPSCSSNRLGKTVFILHEKDPDEVIDNGYTNGQYTGLKQTNYCPIAEYQTTSTEFSTGFCYDPKTSIDEEISEERGSDSFCILSSLIKTESFRAVCYRMSCSSQSLTIKVGGNYIVCPRTGGQVKPFNIEGYLLCPDYNLICTGNKTCNNITNCLDSKEKDDTLEYNYDIKTTQNSYVYNVGNPELSEGWELAGDGHCPQYCMQCGQDRKCVNCAPGYKKYNEEEGKCYEIVPNCLSYDNNEVCISCKTNFFLAKEDNGTIICQSDENVNQYYQQEGQDFKIRCHHLVDNCDKCDSTEGKCNVCNSGYEKIDGGLICGDLSSKLFYYDSDNSIYKKCSDYPYFSNCKKCVIGDTDEFDCLECSDNYALAHESTSTITCKLKSELTNIYFTTDNINYYPCDSDQHNIPNCAKCSTKTKCSECKSSFTTANDGEKCILTSDITGHLYYNDPVGSNYYYLCQTSLANCIECESKTKCTKCSTNYEIEECDICISKADIEANLYYKGDLNKYISCSKITNCEKCTSATECISCKTGFKFVEGDDDKISCQNIDTSNYYQKTVDGKTYFRKCEKDISKCNKCSDGTHCVECVENFAVVEDNYGECKNIATGEYYYDDELKKYKLCSYKLPLCQKCDVENNNFICKECSSTFSLKHDSSIACEETTSLEGNKNFYTNDSKINYYSCRLFNDALNCDECSNKEICVKCQNGYDMYNDNKLCVRQGDIDNNIFIWTNGNLLMPCSSLIKDCHQCNDTTTCYSCQNGAAIIGDNNTCINETILIEDKNYFKDENTQKYISCSSVINNCITCDSSTICTSCQTGFTLNNNLCKNDDDDDDGLSTGEIIGIVFGCIGFLLLVAFVIYFLITKVFKKNNNITINENALKNKEEKVPENEEQNAVINEEKQNEVVVHSTKRTIHNQ